MKIKEKNMKMVSASSENQTPFMFAFVWNEPVRIDPATTFAARQNKKNKPAAFHLHFFAHFYFQSFFPPLSMWILSQFTCIQLVYSAFIFFFCHRLLVLLLHVMCILFNDSWFFFRSFASSLHRYTFLQIQYVWTPSVTQSIGFLYAILFILSSFCLHVQLHTPRGFCLFDGNINGIFYGILKTENN